jgi:hypothetical protein
VLKSSSEISHVNEKLKTNISEMEEISETLVFKSTLTWLIAREDFSIELLYDQRKNLYSHTPQQISN